MRPGRNPLEVPAGVRDMPSRVSVGARLHIGFTNLSLERDRLYGGIGLATAEPRTVVTAARGDRVACESAEARPLVEQVVDLLDVPGATVQIEEALPRHVGLGSGTRLAMAVLWAIAEAYEKPTRLRERAPALGRGGRSGVGVATISRGGFVVDIGHPSAAFTPSPPERGNWTVPAVGIRRSIPTDWRFVIVIPEAPAGRSGPAEDDAMRTVVSSADASISDRVARCLVETVLPGLATGATDAFGSGVEAIDRANGEWYADVQDGVYRSPAGEIIETLRESPETAGVGQSSWGPAVWAITDAAEAATVESAAWEAIDDLDAGGHVVVTRGSNEGGTARNV